MFFKACFFHIYFGFTIYYYMNKIKNKKTILSNFAIFFMLVGLFSIALVSPFKMVSGIDKSNVFYNGDTKKGVVSLMINVYWGNEYLPDMLKTLKENNITTTFFVGGSWVEKYPELFLKIVEDGHEIGNHGYFHKDQAKLSYQENQTEILANHKIVKEYSSVSMNLFAPPSGSISQNVISAATDLGYKTIMWTKDTIDWRDNDVDLIVKRATSSVGSGDLILMHPTKQTALALPKIIELILQKGLSLGTVSQNLW